MLRAALLLLLVLFNPAFAAEARTYAVLSLVGDKLMVARFQIGTGSRLDTNAKAYVEVPGGELDGKMVFAVEDAIKKADPTAKVLLMMAKDPALYAQSAAPHGSAAAVLPALQGMVAGARATHLVLVTKHRDEARIPLADGSVGSGWLEGLGFYIDDQRRLVMLESGEQSAGLLAPFGYLRFTLVELPASRVVREANATRAIAVMNQRATSTWENLTGPQKARMLERIVRAAAEDAVPKLLAP